MYQMAESMITACSHSMNLAFARDQTTFFVEQKSQPYLGHHNGDSPVFQERVKPVGGEAGAYGYSLCAHAIPRLELGALKLRGARRERHALPASQSLCRAEIDGELPARIRVAGPRRK